MPSSVRTRRRTRFVPANAHREPSVDLGPGIRQVAIVGPTGELLRDAAGKPILDEKGRRQLLVAELRSPDVVREDRADPDNANRTVRGARKRDSLRTMWAAGDITGPHWLAVEDFRADLALAGGANLQADQAGIRVAVTPGRYGPSDAQIDALARAKGAHQAMGLTLAGIVSWVIVSGGYVRDYETCKRVGHGKGKAMLLLALDRLADFYTRTHKRR